MSKRLMRSNDRFLGGVCAGIADYFGWDATWVRIGYALLSILTVAPGFLIYIILWIVVPPES